MKCRWNVVFIAATPTEKSAKAVKTKASKKGRLHDLKKYPSLVKLFRKQYKHGFAIMTKCCLLIETLASFLRGNDKTEKDRGVELYTKVFKKAKDYENDLKKFVDKKIY